MNSVADFGSGTELSYLSPWMLVYALDPSLVIAAAVAGIVIRSTRIKLSR
jgi:hypothetical protein